MNAHASRRLLLFTLTVACAVLNVASAAVTITGKVVDENGAPVREARIVASRAGMESTASSDPAGAFRLEIASPGDYRLEAQRDGFFLSTIPSVALAEDTSLEIRMSHLKEL